MKPENAKSMFISAIVFTVLAMIICHGSLILIIIVIASIGAASDDPQYQAALQAGVTFLYIGVGIDAAILLVLLLATVFFCKAAASKAGPVAFNNMGP